MYTLNKSPIDSPKRFNLPSCVQFAHKSHPTLLSLTTLVSYAPFVVFPKQNTNTTKPSLLFSFLLLLLPLSSHHYYSF